MRLVFDCETYRDFFAVVFRDIDTGRTREFCLYDDHPFDVESVSSIVRSSKVELIGFNSRAYDAPLVVEALAGADNAALKALSDSIIRENYRADCWLSKIERHIDLIEVAPGKASLKLYGGRLHAPRLQDLPIDPDASIAPDQRRVLLDYCGNDLELTRLLFLKLEQQIDLRRAMSEQYGIDLKSKSDAQIAEAVLIHEIEAATGAKAKAPQVASGTAYRYQAPEFIHFQTQQLQDVFDLVCAECFVVGDDGAVRLPDSLADLVVSIGGSAYRLGIGGLHSTEKSASHQADDRTLLIDRDVASYYPSIILRCGLYPRHLTSAFLEVYRSIVERRLAAKHSGNKVTADTLKIVLNGSFGKFGSKYSALYSPDLLIQVTLTGQLALLMLIEALEQDGIAVVSANTDGVVIKCHVDKVPLLDAHVGVWESITGFVTEETRYRALYSRDVNNYVAIKPDNSVKTKGTYASPSLQKNPANAICVAAVIAYLRDGTPVEQTINESDDIRQFVTVRRVSGGARIGDRELGKTVRWIYTGRLGAMHYRKNGNKVPRSDAAEPLLDLDELPLSAVDRSWYANEARQMVAELLDARPPPAPAPQFPELISQTFDLFERHP